MQDSDTNVEEYLRAFLCFYLPDIQDHHSELLSSLLKKAQLQQVIELIPLDQRDEAKPLLKQKRLEIGKIVEGKYLKIDQKFQNDMAFIFNDLKIKQDITYYKYKVVNGIEMGDEEFQEEEKFLEDSMIVKIHKLVTSTVRKRLPELRAKRSKYYPLLKKILEESTLYKEATIVEKLNETVYTILNEDKQSFENLDNYFAQQLQYSQWKSFKELVQNLQNILINKMELEGTPESNQRESVLPDYFEDLFNGEAEFLDLKESFRRKIEEKFTLLPTRDQRIYYINAFPDRLDFQQFCYELYNLSDWKMIISRIFTTEKTQKFVKKLIQKIINDEILFRQTILNRCISQDLKIDWNLPRWCERAYSRIHQGRQTGKTQDEQLVDCFRKVAQSCSRIVDIVRWIVIYFHSAITRRYDLRKFFEKIECVKQIQYKNPNNKWILFNFSLDDILMILLKNYPKKQELGYHLYNYRLSEIESLPIPIFVSYFNEAKKEQCEQNNVKLLYLLNQLDETMLILNVGTTKMIGRGKTEALINHFGISTYTSRSNVGFNKESIVLYAAGTHRNLKKKILLIDFNGDCLNQSVLYSQILKACLKNASLILFHVCDNELQQKNLKTYLDFFNQQKNVQTKLTLLVRDQKSDYVEPNKNVFGHSYLTVFMTHLKFTTKSLRQMRNSNLEQILHQPCRNFVFKELLSYFEKQLYEKWEKLIKEINNNMRDTSQVFQDVFPLFKDYEKSSFLIYSRYWDSQQCYNEEMFSFYEPQHKLSKPVKLFIELFVCNTKALENLWLCQNILNSWVESKKLALKEMLNRSHGRAIQAIQPSLKNLSISLETFIMQILLYCKDQGKSLLIQNQVAVLKLFYLESMKQQLPINIMNTQTFDFGNEYLKQSLKFLRKKFIDHQFYVISIIGCESHAKSSLLNSIFDTKFSVSIGKQTYGINMVVKTEGKKVLILLDYEGIHSSSREDQNFDIRLLSFSMIVSDLLIINHKGQLNSSLEKVIESCQYVVQNINHESPNINQSIYNQITHRNCKPNKVIVALRDIVLNDQTNNLRNQETNQQTEALKIVDRFNRQNEVIENQITLDVKDIFMFENAFYTNEQGRKCGQKYAEKILKLRAMILESLPEHQPKFKSLFNFYSQSEQIWKKLKNLKKEDIYKFQQKYWQQKQKVIVAEIYKQYEKIMTVFKEKSQLFFIQIQKKCRQEVNDEQTMKEKKKQWFKQLQKLLIDEKARMFTEIREFMINLEDYKLVEREELRKYQRELRFLQYQQTHRLTDIVEERTQQIRRQHYIEHVQRKISELDVKKSNFMSVLTEQLRAQQKLIDDELQLFTMEEINLAKRAESAEKKTSSQHNISISEYVEDSPTLKHPKQTSRTLKQLEERVLTQIQGLTKGEGALLEDKRLSSYRKKYKEILISNPSHDYHILEQFLENSLIDNYYKIAEQYPETIINILTFFKTGESILNQTIEKHITSFQKTQINNLLGHTRDRLTQHYEELKRIIELRPLPVQQSAILEPYIDIKIKSRMYFLIYFYAQLPDLCIKRIIYLNKESINAEVQYRKSINNIVKKQFQLFSRGKMEQKCLFWLNTAYNYFAETEIKELKYKIDKIIKKYQIPKAERVLIKILFGSIFDDYESEAKWIRCYKAITNMEKFMVEVYLSKYFDWRVQPEIDNEIKEAKKRLLYKCIAFQDGIKLTYERKNDFEEQNLQEVFIILLNGKQLFLKEKWNGVNFEQFLLCFVKLMKNDKQDIQQSINTYLKKMQIQGMKAKYDILKKDVFDKVIGCRAKCPLCGMKCRFQKNHNGKHEIIPKAHLLHCFSPSYNFNEKYLCQSSEKYYSWCCRKEHCETDADILSYLSQKELGWFEEIKTQMKCDDVELENKLIKIWANIGEVLLMQTKNVKIKFTGDLKSLKCPSALTLESLKRQDLEKYHLE